MRNILFLCERFPFGEGEGFISNELFSNVGNASITLIPVTRRSFSRAVKSFGFAQRLDMGIVRLGSKKNMVVNYLKALLSKDFADEMRELRRTGRLCAYNVQLLMLYLSTAICAYNYIKDNYHAILSNEENPAIVYAYWLSAPALTAALLKRRYPHIQVVARCHGFDCLQERAKHDYLVAMPLKLRSIDYLYPASSYAANEINTRYPGLTKVETRFLGTSIQPFQDVSLDGPLTIVSCSRVDANKNVGYLAEALSHIAPNGRPIRWVHFGDGPGLAELKTRAAQLLANSPVTAEFKGARPNREVLDFYTHTPVCLFVHASKSEGGPVVSIMEALSFGTPVIALDAGGTRDSVVDDGGGLLLPADATPERFAQATEDVLAHSADQYRSLRHAARKLWEKRFNASVNYPAFYAELETLGGKKAGPTED